MMKREMLKRIFSVCLAVLMLVAIVPMGLFTVSAREEYPTIDLSNYDEAEEYVIMNTADWLLISESDKDFYGITVKLGADIDAGGFTEVLRPERFDPTTGENLPLRGDGRHPTSGIERCRDEYAATFPTLFKNFAGTFDGQGYTIRHARVEEGLIAAVTLDGAEIKNVNVVDCQCCDFVDYNDYGLVVGVAKGSLTLDGINVVRGFVPANTFNSVHFNGGGGLVGLADANYKLASGEEPVDDAKLTITNCNIEADVHTGGEHSAVGTNIHGTGIVVGTVMPNFDFEMKNCNISGNVDTYAFYAGAIGLLHVGEERTATIENINLDNVNVSASRGSFTWGAISSGALVAAISPRNYAQVDISKINVTNSHVGRRTCGVSGGLIGTIQAFDAVNGGQAYLDVAPVVGAEINISDIYIADTVVEQFDLSSSSPNYGGAGGLIGQIGEGGSSDAFYSRYSNVTNADRQAARIFRGDINIYNCYVGATVITGWVKSPDRNFYFGSERIVQAYDQGAGGLFAFVSAATAEIYVSNTVVDVEFPYNQIIEMKDGVPFVGDLYSVNSVGLISYAGAVRCGYNGAVIPGFSSEDRIDSRYMPGEDGFYESYFYVDDVLTTFEGDIYSVVLLNRRGGIHYNGVDIGCGDKAANYPHTDENIGRVEDEAVMIRLDDDGFYAGYTVCEHYENLEWSDYSDHFHTATCSECGVLYRAHEDTLYEGILEWDDSYEHRVTCHCGHQKIEAHEYTVPLEGEWCEDAEYACVCGLHDFYDHSYYFELVRKATCAREGEAFVYCDDCDYEATLIILNYEDHGAPTYSEITKKTHRETCTCGYDAVVSHEYEIIDDNGCFATYRCDCGHSYVKQYNEKHGYGTCKDHDEELHKVICGGCQEVTYAEHEWRYFDETSGKAGWRCIECGRNRMSNMQFDFFETLVQTSQGSFGSVKARVISARDTVDHGIASLKK